MSIIPDPTTPERAAARLLADAIAARTGRPIPAKAVEALTELCERIVTAMTWSWSR